MNIGEEIREVEVEDPEFIPAPAEPAAPVQVPAEEPVGV